MQLDLDKPFVTLTRAAALLGVPFEVALADVRNGVAGKIGTLTGGIAGGYWLVQSSDLTDEALEYHRKRLSADSSVAP